MSWNWATEDIKNDNKKQRDILNDLVKKIWSFIFFILLTQFHFLWELNYFEYDLPAFF